MQKKEFKRHLKIRYDRIIKCLIFLLFFVFAVMYILNVRVKNIYIVGNKYVKDQEIIELAGISDYPKMIEINSLTIKNKLAEENIISEVNVEKKNTSLILTVKEAKPLYYDNSERATILENGKKINKKYVFYTLNEKVENDLVKMYVSEVSNGNALSDNMTNDEWNNIKGIMKSILTANNNENIKYLNWEA